MELDLCIKGRRSVRAYEEKPVPKDVVEAILEAGVWAPTGMNRQPWRFVIIEDKSVIKFISDETKKAVTEMMPSMAKRYETQQDRDWVCFNAPMLILTCAETKATPQIFPIDLIDSALAAQNMSLKAYDLGLGTCYMGFVYLLSKKPDVLRRAGMPEGYELMVPLILGYPKNKQGPGKRNNPNIVKWIR
jgi:nitroreductase